MKLLQERECEKEMKYDDASWHYGGLYPDNLPKENAAIHIGMFISWCLENDLISDELLSEEQEIIEKIKIKKSSGASLLWRLDGKFISDDLNDVGNAYALDYYEGDSYFAETYNNYINDYSGVFTNKEECEGFVYQSLYHVEDSLENYLLIKEMLDRRFEEWQLFGNDNMKGQ